MAWQKVALLLFISLEIPPTPIYSGWLIRAYTLANVTQRHLVHKASDSPGLGARGEPRYWQDVRRRWQSRGMAAVL